MVREKGGRTASAFIKYVFHSTRREISTPGWGKSLSGKWGEVVIQPDKRVTKKGRT